MRLRLTNFLNHHLFGAAYGLMVISSLFLLPAFNADMQGDVTHYRGIANDLLKGILPYRDAVVEYPPYALPVFLLPRLFGDDNYLDGFIGFAFAADWAVKLCLFSIGFRQSKTARALLPLLLYCAAMPFTRFFLLQRYDLFPAAICLAAICWFCSQRFFLCGLALAVGVGMKLYPALFVPPLLVLVFRQGRWKSFVGGLVAGLWPLLLLSFYLPWWRFAQFQADRGLQVESLYASVLWLGNRLGWFHVNWVYTKMWFEVQGTAATTLLPWARALFTGSVLGSVAFAVWAARRLEKPSLPQLARILLLPLLAFVIFNQVFSPQYMIWLLPLAALTVFAGGGWIGLAIALATLLTPIIYPSWHGDYRSGLDLGEALVLCGRNLLLALVWAGLFRAILRPAGRDTELFPPAARTLNLK